MQSGLVVETTATFDAEKQAFVLHTPHRGARKNWISQGFVADKTVVVADLIIGGKSKGPHAFIMDFRVKGELAKGIAIDDMGRKTTGDTGSFIKQASANESIGGEGGTESFLTCFWNAPSYA